MELRAAARSAVGPLVIGGAVWCALGTVAIAGPDAAPTRLAVAAPAYWFPLAVAAAALVGPWRRHPMLASPSLLATVPWWPVPLPAVALMWAGPMAWTAIGLAVVAAFVRLREDSSQTGTADRPIATAAAAGAVTLIALVLTAWSFSHSTRLPGGDEPNYLIITQSLLYDGDLKIANNHAARQYASYYALDLAPDFRVRGRNGEVYSIHAPGTSAVVLPGFALAGYRGAQATMVILAAVASGLMWYAAWVATSDRRAAWFAWLAVAATPTFLIQGVTIFPDGIGMFIVAAAVLALTRAGSGRAFSLGGILTLSVLLALLPWLHTRFAVLAAGLGGLAAWLIISNDTRDRTERYRNLGVFLLVPIVSAVAWFGFFQVIYGTPDPTVPYGDDESRNTSLAFVPGGVVGLLFDAQFGLLAYSPILAAALVGLVVAGRGRVAGVTRGAAVVGLAYLAASATYWMWWAGVPAPPARFAAAALPVLAVPLALAWRASGQALRAMWSVLLAVSVAAAALVASVRAGDIAWNDRGVRAAWLDWLGAIADLSRGWPSFFWRLDTERLASELHFAGHAALWVVVFGGSAMLVLRSRRRAAPDRPHVLAAVWWFVCALMIAVQGGWWLNGTRGLNAAESQLAVMNEVAAGRRVVTIAPWRIARDAHVTGQLRIRATRADEVGEPGARWLPLLELPPGQYALTISQRRPRGGRLDLRVGRSLEPAWRLPVAAVASTTLPLWLPAGARALRFEPDANLAAAGDMIELTPLRIDRAPFGYATASTHYGDATVFFHGPSVFAEPDGFWVRGGQTSAFTVVKPGAQAVTFSLENGASANDVTMEWGTRRERLPLASSASRTVAVDTSADGAALIRVTSPSGFRPSDAGTSDDRRYLGVRVRLE